MSAMLSATLLVKSMSCLQQHLLAQTSTQRPLLPLTKAVQPLSCGRGSWQWQQQAATSQNSLSLALVMVIMTVTVATFARQPNQGPSLQSTWHGGIVLCN